VTKVAITTLVPIEVLFAAGRQPVDMNNVFIGDDRWEEFMAAAEQAGFSQFSCSWLKGIYGAMLADSEMRTVVGVVVGDCSDTHVLLEYLERQAREVIPFAYMREHLPAEMERFMARFDVGWEQVRAAHERCQAIRRQVWRMDELTWRENAFSGWDNHLYQVSCSDMGGDIDRFEAEVAQLQPAPEPINPEGLRLGVLGVPSMFASDLYRFLEGELGVKVVFNETQRQFSLPFDCDLVEQYTRFTYPYGTAARIADIAAEVERRSIDGLIHYVQAFCFREPTDALLRQDVPAPILSLTGNRERRLDVHAQTRLEAFVDMLARSRARGRVRPGAGEA